MRVVHQRDGDGDGGDDDDDDANGLSPHKTKLLT